MSLNSGRNKKGDEIMAFINLSKNQIKTIKSYRKWVSQNNIANILGLRPNVVKEVLEKK